MIADDSVFVDLSAFGMVFVAAGFNFFVAINPVAVANTPTFLYDLDAATQTLRFDADGIGPTPFEVVAVFAGLAPQYVHGE